jgi:septum formation protein
VAPADVDESPPPGPLAQAVVALALRKAQAVARRSKSGTVLGADTVIDRDGELLGKPAGADDARAMLASLSGRAHRVLTGVALVRAPSGPARTGVAVSTVEFRALRDQEIDAYVATGEPFGKAGAYAIQGGAQAFLAGLHGELDNVVGLPLSLVRRLLAELAAAGSARGE